MIVECRRVLVAIATKVVFVGLIFVLRAGRISMDTGNIVLTLAVGTLSYFGLPVRNP
ncbi:MAG: hypothetical protein M3464_18630 [Chloroflexota bacterium]|nr:hypothetical protein [Chloroflexota bacterium]